MLMLFLTFGVALGLALLLTPLAGRLAARGGLVDRPDGWRKMHARPIPLGGGPAVLLAACAAVLAVLLLDREAAGHILAERHKLVGLLLAATMICGVGVADDYGLLRGRHKLLGQIGAAGIVIASGLVIDRVHIFQWRIDLGLLAVPFTLFWLLGAVNALNLLDGMDGLLATVGLIISTAIAAMAALQNDWNFTCTACVACALSGALLGFLRYNFPPARIFLGDSGSMLIGLVIGTLALRSSLKGPATVALAAPTALLAIPIFDTAAAIVRRKLTGRSIYTTDRGHLHHCLLGRGLSARAVLLCISSFCLLTVVGVMVSTKLNSEIYAVLTAAAVVGVLITGRVFGYAEFVLVKQTLLAHVGALWPSGRAAGRSEQLQVRLQGSADWSELWEAVTACAAQLELRVVRLDVNAPSLQEGYHARWGRLDDAEEDPAFWRAEIPVAAEGRPVGRLLLVGPCDVDAVHAKIEQVEKLVRHFGSRPPGRNGKHSPPLPAPHASPPPVPAPPETASRSPARVQ